MEWVKVKSVDFSNIVLWLFLNVADWGVTVAFMGKGVGELNPIIAWLNPDAFLIYKLLIPVAVLVGLYRWDRLHLLKPLNLIMCVVVLWGVFWLII